jgi:alanyl-tRNA synthetase
VATTRAEEERFRRDDRGGMARFDELRPPARRRAGGARGEISGDDAFRLYDNLRLPDRLGRA